MTSRQLASLGPLVLLSSCWLVGCADAPSELETIGAWPLQGTLEVIVVEGPQGGTRYFLAQEGVADRLELDFDQAPRLGSGTRVGLRREPRGTKLLVSDLVALKPPSDAFPRRVGERVGIQRQALAGEIRARTIGFALVDFNNDGLNLTKDKAQSFMFSTTNPGPRLGLDAGDRSVAQYYEETSFAQLKISGGVETGLAWNQVACNGNGGSELARTLADKIPTDYDHYIWYYGQEQPNCGYGWGSLGTWDRPSGDIWFNGDLFDGAIAHEFGHNLGYQHASSIKCNGTPLANDPLTCQTVEYGSTVSVMGNLSNGHMMAIEKWYSGWLQGCNAVRVRSSGTFTLHAIETACGGVQALQIAMPVNNRRFDTDQSRSPNPARYYYLEFRAGTGLDTGMTPAVMVHASDDIQPPDETCARSVLLDMKPSTNQVDGMLAGSSFTDPAGGVTFSVSSATATSAVVNVTLSGAAQPNTCMDGTTLVGSGPTTCGGGAGGNGGAGTGGTGGIGGVGTAGASGAGGGLGGVSGMPAGGNAGTAGASGGAPPNGRGGASTSGGAGAGGFSTGGGGGANGGFAGFGAAGLPPVSGASPSTPAVAPAGEESGCGCAVPGSGATSNRQALYLLAPLAFAWARRRRRQSANG